MRKGDIMDKDSFDTMRNGYNRYQVDDYIQTRKLQESSLQKQLDFFKQQQQETQSQLLFIQEQYEEVLRNLSMKEKAANEMARIAMKEANMIVDTAQQNADVIVREALMTARGILLDIARLGNEANDFKGTMKEQLQQLTLALDEFETPAIPDMNLLKQDL